MLKLNQARAMDRLGRVVLPIEVRNALNWHEETLLDIYYDTDAGEVRLKAHENTCVHCGSTQVPCVPKKDCGTIRRIGLFCG